MHDIVRRNSLLVTRGSSFVWLQGAWRMGESVKEIKLVSSVRLRIRINTTIDGHAWEDQFLSTVRQFPVRWEFASSPARRDSLFNRHWVTSHTLFKTRSPENTAYWLNTHAAVLFDVSAAIARNKLSTQIHVKSYRRNFEGKCRAHSDFFHFFRKFARLTLHANIWGCMR